LKYKFKRIGTIQNTYSLLRTAPIEFDRQTEKNFEKYTHIDCFDFNAKYKSLYTSTIKQSNEYFSAVLSTERFKLQNDINIIKDML
jgi:hypothetical protein